MKPAMPLKAIVQSWHIILQIHFFKKAATQNCHLFSLKSFWSTRITYCSFLLDNPYLLVSSITGLFSNQFAICSVILNPLRQPFFSLTFLVLKLDDGALESCFISGTLCSINTYRDRGRLESPSSVHSRTGSESSYALDTENSLLVPKPSSKLHVFAQLTPSTFSSFSPFSLSLLTTASISKSKQLWRDKLFCLMSHQHSLFSVSKQREHTESMQQLLKMSPVGNSLPRKASKERWASCSYTESQLEKYRFKLPLIP